MWLSVEALAKAGYIASGGQIVDANIVNALKQHNTRDESEAIKAGGAGEFSRTHDFC